MTKVISLSGIWNTGKTTLIERIRDKLEKKGKTVAVLGESARDVMESISPNDSNEFQKAIYDVERAKAERLASDEIKEYDYVITDRTWVDNLAYLLFNLCSKKYTWWCSIDDLWDVYDMVIIFNEPIKETTTEAFQHYNDEALEVFMTTMIKTRFSEISKVYRNWLLDGDKVLEDILAFE